MYFASSGEGGLMSLNINQRNQDVVRRYVAQLGTTLAGWTGTIMQPVTNYLFRQDGCPSADGTCPNSNISFYLYTRDTQNSPQRLDPLDSETLRQAKFVQGVPLKVIIHGYTGNKDYSPNMELRPAYFKHGEYNIVTVDWSPLAAEPCYWEAAHNVDTVGHCAAEFLDLLYQTRSDISVNNTHIVGFSLGAHTAATVASNLKSGKVPRLTGLDPALPLFDDWTNSLASLIDPGDAMFVDVYHSNMGHKGKKAVGGTIDVYLNNGANQPGCNCNRSCDHVRAVEYFAESITSPVGLWGFACWSWNFYTNGFCKVSNTEELILLGEPISPEEHGVYMAFTNYSSPFLLPPSVYVEDDNITEKIDVSCSWV
ncbi:pancreatic lipase-related protein 2-like [Macrosteles quadrilineatus]|uniref:pancreatic lipase-related protein 2-like n=1 Tax=Macrosteles quadrilineatus TaxID=74068 RepID=UPI0023E1BA18|nr:pancreatic lipase-related protein 2-like [Macrosteles quadrilineatus]